MILGLTGKNGAGKGEVARILMTGGFEYHSLSDAIRLELQSRELEPTRDAMIDEGRRLRREHGLDVLARRAAGGFTRGLNQVVDSIRNPEEVRYLRTLPGFFLIAVDAPAAVRFKRSVGRARAGDTMDLASFEEAERREWASGDPAAQQLDATLALADFTIDNSGDREVLAASVVRFFQEAAARISPPDWDTYFMAIADVVAMRSSCVKRHVAAVVVKDRRIISTGYNGTPRGVQNCNQGGCSRCMALVSAGAALETCVCSHAEENAIVQAAFHGVSLRGTTLYTTFSPCLLCTKLILNAGIIEVVFGSHYELPEKTIELLKGAGIKVRQVER